FHTIIIGVTTTISNFSNSLLMFIVATTASEHIGSYKHLLLFFAICNFVTTIGHAILQAYCHLTPSGFYFFPRIMSNIFIFSVPLATISCIAFMAAFYQTYLILAYHFVYRYKTVTRLGSSCTDNWSRKHWIIVGITVYVIYMSSFEATALLGMSATDQTRRDVPAEILKIYGMDLRDSRTGFLVITFRVSR
ncbi:hypothetical protein PENTCL1PPCAC_14302, partial [Pristionchus entomophagus]